MCLAGKYRNDRRYTFELRKAGRNERGARFSRYCILHNFSHFFSVAILVAKYNFFEKNCFGKIIFIRSSSVYRKE